MPNQQTLCCRELSNYRKLSQNFQRPVLIPTCKLLPMTGTKESVRESAGYPIEFRVGNAEPTCEPLPTKGFAVLSRQM
jgi:hypothetical protein